MDPSRITASTQSIPRPRPAPRGPSRTLTLAAVALVGTGAAFKYVATTMRENELAQRSSGLYVSVDRSGGGI
ncbi:hypothetical protein QBC34DRAFT_157092 [Podospora aff. communis PSN243]|uniref:Uncharacterized protein n=1 Tax=Podospora aff. communis PSN243 TaxID=3040156 RepID=A0AAV9H2B3_9PEZI|nr:hypothetical protein QBC34DRAFT_157092 [Podospora aff. communis PSN243]